MNRLDVAFATMKREDFLPDNVKAFAEIDEALPIGFDQTNSQPSTVRKMVEWLDPQPGNRVLDIGSGSGWTTALLSYLVGPQGHIYATEIIPDLLTYGAQNCSRHDIHNVDFIASNGVGLPQFAPYDRILVSAAAAEVPEQLLLEVQCGGIIVIPVRDTIQVITRQHDMFQTTVHKGFQFVPLLIDAK